MLRTGFFPVAVVILLLFLPGNVYSSRGELPVMEIIPGVETYPLSQHVGYSIEPTPPLAPEFLISDESDFLFDLNQSEYLSFGLTSNVYWLKIKFHNISTISEWMLELGYPQLDHVSVFVVYPGRGIMAMQSGDMLNLSNRPLGNRHIVIPLSFPQGEIKTVLVRVYHQANMIVPINLYSFDQFEKKNGLETLFLGIVFGMVLLGLLYSVWLFWQYRRGVFLFHCMFIISIGSYIASLNGLPAEWLWGSLPEMNNIQYFSSVFLCVFFSTQFSRAFLESDIWVPKLDRLLAVGAYITVFLAIMPFFLPGMILATLAFTAAPSLVVLATIVGVWTWKKGNPNGKLYLLSMLVLFITIFMMLFSALNLFPAGRWVNYQLQVALIVEVIVFTTALGFVNLNTVPTIEELLKKNALIMGTNPGQQKILNSISSLANPTQSKNFQLKISTLGGFEAWHDLNQVNFGSRGSSKPLLLLKSIISLGPQNIPENLLGESIWPDSDGDLVKGSLKTNLFRLRKIIGFDAISHSGGQVSLDTGYCWIDSEVFENQVRRLLHTGKMNPEDYQQVLALYHGEFLAGEDHPTFIQKRARLKQSYMECVCKLASSHMQKGEHEQAMELYNTGIRKEPQLEVFYQGLMRCCLETEDWAGGIQVYQNLAGVLESNLETQPSGESVRLLMALKKQQASA